MDIEEFEKQEQPRAKRSRLEPYLVQILRLKSQGYANHQVCKWLSTNGVTVSPEAVRKFVKSRNDKVPKWKQLTKPIQDSSTAKTSVAGSSQASESPKTEPRKFVHNSNPNLDDLF